MNAPLSEAEEHARVSVKENRVYVGNLPYNCTYMDLKNALKEGGWIFWIFGLFPRSGTDGGPESVEGVLPRTCPKPSGHWNGERVR